ncbi:MAG: carbamoyltransferase HypF [Deltaproteobacteria bacterium]|nr:carbamoyltransferase HypF [Deltaproteobacteria bacterium]
MNRARIHITGIVQGVGFRPFVYSLAMRHDLRGFCRNDSEGVTIEVEGERIEGFISEIKAIPPPLSRIDSLTVERLSPASYTDFRIVESVSEEGKFALVSPDIATCKDCASELFDPNDRRFRYPFINCTNCGPRYSIILDIPYDRPKTTMSKFSMCALCEEEYHDPRNRRFHSQPNACPACGPAVWLVRSGTEEGVKEGGGDASIERARELLREGAIVAIKGLGGFHIAADATNNDSVKRLRERKRKSNKSFAVMSPDIDAVRGFSSVSRGEEEILSWTLMPIVNLEKKPPNLI